MKESGAYSFLGWMGELKETGSMYARVYPQSEGSTKSGYVSVQMESIYVQPYVIGAGVLVPHDVFYSGSQTVDHQKNIVAIDAEARLKTGRVLAKVTAYTQGSMVHGPCSQR